MEKFRFFLFSHTQSLFLIYHKHVKSKMQRRYFPHLLNYSGLTNPLCNISHKHGIVRKQGIFSRPFPNNSNERTRQRKSTDMCRQIFVFSWDTSFPTASVLRRYFIHPCTIYNKKRIAVEIS